ncbi:MAG: hypothetical protein Q4A88_07775 [Clostridia bacterium]|nr:hypothetical protein [Clostridia bacterium]
MKKKLLVAISLILCLFLAFGTIAENLEQGTEPEQEIDEVQVPVETDQYGFTGWKTLDQAKAYYGYNWTYCYCGGSIYNYFYYFSDGSRMFFGVHG